MNLRGKYSDVLIFVAVLVVTMGVMIYVIYGQINNMINTNKEAETISLAISQENGTFNDLIRIKSELPIYERQLAQIKKLIPDSLNEAEITDYLQMSALKGNVEITSIQYSEPVTKNNYLERNVVFTISSKYDGFLTFLGSLQNGEKLVIIDNIEISAKTGDSGVNAQISARMFFSEPGG
jgi:Tfp pilus assembly protein PilO